MPSLPYLSVVILSPYYYLPPFSSLKTLKNQNNRQKFRAGEKKKRENFEERNVFSPYLYIDIDKLANIG